MYSQKEVIIDGRKTVIPVVSGRCKVVYHPEGKSLVQAQMEAGVTVSSEDKDEEQYWLSVEAIKVGRT